MVDVIEIPLASRLLDVCRLAFSVCFSSPSASFYDVPGGYEMRVTNDIRDANGCFVLRQDFTIRVTSSEARGLSRDELAALLIRKRNEAMKPNDAEDMVA